MKNQLAFTPSGASILDFRPRVWFGIAPSDQRGSCYEEPSSPCHWGLFLFNGGPQLTGVEVEILSIEPDTEPKRVSLGDLGPEENAYVFLGGPALEPPEIVVRLRAKGAGGVPVSHAVRLRGLERPLLVPEEVSRQPVLPLAAGAGWHPEEYMAEIKASSMTGATESASPAGRALSRAVARLLIHAHGLPSLGASKEIAWAATRAVFGASENDLQEPAVAEVLAELAAGVRAAQRSASSC